VVFAIQPRALTASSSPDADRICELAGLRQHKGHHLGRRKPIPPGSSRLRSCRSRQLPGPNARGTLPDRRSRQCSPLYVGVLFTLVASTIKTFDEAAVVVMTLVSAPHRRRPQSTSRPPITTLFDPPRQVVPFLHRARRRSPCCRRSPARACFVAAPIALGCALTMCAPLPLYCARQARTKIAPGSGRSAASSPSSGPS